jgi:NTP pyrophosphatase (non-canonical NTP hydrolase)
LKYQELEVKVLDWAHDKGILDKATPLAQAKKTKEEVNELLEACVAQQNGQKTFTNFKGKLVNTQEEVEDALGDIFVTIIIGAELQGVSLENCLEKAYNVISKRTGVMRDGQFVKNVK